MNIWIDGDACPNSIKQILFKASIKRKVPLYIVANHSMYTPPSLLIKRILVAAGFDAADDYISTHVQKNDLVVTADIILADHIVQREAHALNPRGTLYSVQNIKQILAIRNMSESLRNQGMISGHLSPLSNKDIQNFSNHLDKMITQFQGQSSS